MSSGKRTHSVRDMGRESESTWVPPGRGQWHREVAHFPRGQTPVYRAIYEPASATGLAASFARYGLPVSHLEMRHVHDRAYVRLLPLVEPPSLLSGHRPPAAAVWLLSRVLPELRHRTGVARAAWEERRWRDDARRWAEEQKPAIEQANLALQDESPQELPASGLRAHLEAVVRNLRRGIITHFDLVGPNVVPVGAYLDAAVRAGLRPDAALALLAGCSPGSAAGVADLEPVARHVVAGGRSPQTLDELRAIGDEVAASLDRWLRCYGHRVVTSYDVDGPTLVELPDVVLRSILAVAADEAADGGGSDSTLFDDVPSGLRAEIDDLLSEAAPAYALRDDNASITLSWPAGLLRRALLVLGDRLACAGRIAAPEHVFELRPDEVLAVAGGAASPDADRVRMRAELRRSRVAAPAPLTLGPAEPLPSLDPLPRPLRRVGRAALAVYDLMNTSGADPLVGTGIGTTVVRGRATVASSAEEALARLEVGGVLVVPYTTPAYNALLPIAAALVVEEGGALSHAALVARELGVPAVIGLPGITDRIPDGSNVEVDPRAGTVRVLVSDGG